MTRSCRATSGCSRAGSSGARGELCAPLPASRGASCLPSQQGHAFSFSDPDLLPPLTGTPVRTLPVQEIQDRPHLGALVPSAKSLLPGEVTYSQAPGRVWVSLGFVLCRPRAPAVGCTTELVSGHPVTFPWLLVFNHFSPFGALDHQNLGWEVVAFWEKCGGMGLVMSISQRPESHPASVS